MDKSIQKFAVYVGGSSLMLGMIIYLLASVQIGVEVNKLCSRSTAKFEGECVEALVQVLTDEGVSFRDRNQIVWALGQLGDPRALPTLQSYYTTQISQREALDESLSQYELHKAIKLINSQVNITAWLWRWRIEGKYF